jgi:hypothetical protein
MLEAKAVLAAPPECRAPWLCCAARASKHRIARLTSLLPSATASQLLSIIFIRPSEAQSSRKCIE